MASKQHATKRSAQTLSNSMNNTPIKSVRTKFSKPNDTPKTMEEKETSKEIHLEDIHNMMQIMMKKLDKLEIIEQRIMTVEQFIYLFITNI